MVLVSAINAQATDRDTRGIAAPTLPAAMVNRVTSLSRQIARAAALAPALVALVAIAGPAAALSGSAALPYSSASANAVQRQPPAHSCHAVGSGLYARPDPRCTPGALNPAVTQARIGSTICRSGWTTTVRPPESVTEPEKLASISAYGDSGPVSSYEYDHDVPLELGGAVNDPRNLWPEPDYSSRSGFYLNPKDHLERALNRLVCGREMALSEAQRLIAGNWVSAYHQYG
jgi:hypothetical protein